MDVDPACMICGRSCISLAYMTAWADCSAYPFAPKTGMSDTDLQRKCFFFVGELESK